MTSLDIQLRPDELVAAWRPETRRLVLPSRSAVRVQQRVAARISIAGRDTVATITGRVTSSSRHGDLLRLEIMPDDFRLRAVEKLVSVARGEVVQYRVRAPRFLASIPAFVYGPAGPTYMTTFSVSERGCGLAWSGPVPKIGAAMDFRLGAGNRAAAFRGVVCWTEQSGRGSTVGVRFVEGEKGAWASIFGEVRRSGALPA